MSKQLFYIPPLGPTAFMSSVEYAQQQEKERESRRQLNRDEYERLALWDEDYQKLRLKKKTRDGGKGEVSSEAEITILFQDSWEQALLETKKREAEYAPDEDYHRVMAECEYFSTEWREAKTTKEQEQLRERSRLKTLLFYADFFHYENTGEEKDVSDGA